MPLTPADVHNVAFSKPPIGKRGYNEDEVDAFLDLVENELTRLIEENADLRQRVAELDQDLSSARSGSGVQATQSIPQYQQPEPEPEPVAPPQPVYEAPQPVAAAPVSEDSHIKAAKILGLAQDTADRLTGTAKAESDKMLADARAQADAERKHTEIMGTINQQRTVLEGRLEQLRTFEREYRTRLKTYLESQLEELGQRGSAAPVDSTANNDGGGFNQFNRGNN